MATIRNKNDAWHAQVRRKGYPQQTRTFLNRADAERWAREIESEMDRGIFISRAESEKTTLNEILDRYEREVLPKKRSQKPELSRLKTLKEALGRYKLAAVTSTMITKYRDDRAALGISGQTIIHEITLLNRVFKAAVIDWGISLPGGIPTAMVRKPAKSKARDRRLEPGEVERIQAASQSAELSAIIQLAIETAMRRGEIASLRWELVDLKKRVLVLPITKNGDSRTVPLSSRATELLVALPRRMDGRVFGLAPDSITQAFERACRRAGIIDLRFHDLRHEAASRLFEKGLNPMEVAAITGHKTLEMLKRYTHLRAEDLAKKLG